MSGQRESDAVDPVLIEDEEERAAREASNAVAQFDRALDLIDAFVRSQRAFRLRPSMILDLYRIALDG